MDFIDDKISAYAEAHTTDENAVLGQLNRETNAKILNPRMLSGHLQGRVLSMISHMISSIPSVPASRAQFAQQ